MRLSELNIIHPGWVTSQTDGDQHWISYRQLVRLYRFNPVFCEEYSPRSDHYYSIVAQHYYPRYDGQYDPANYGR